MIKEDFVKDNDDSLNQIKVCECIITHQGEGCNSGVRVLLLRFKECSRKIPCYFCDTQEKLNNSKEFLMTIQELQNLLDNFKVGLLISGGEPSLTTENNDNFFQTILMLNSLKYHTANVESNGFKLIELIEKVNNSNVNFMYSPKIFSENGLNEEIEKSKVLIKHPNVFFKIVFPGDINVENYLKYISFLGINDRIFLMPEGKTKDSILKSAKDTLKACKIYQVNFSSRDHIIYDFS
jgi:organic radical activating enzyme